MKKTKKKKLTFAKALNMIKDLQAYLPLLIENERRILPSYHTLDCACPTHNLARATRQFVAYNE